MIRLLHTPASAEQANEMLGSLGDYIKVAVDIRRGVLAGGGELHADCEQLLLDDGSQQEDVWGADWIPATRTVRYEALINIRPRQDNRSLAIQDPSVRKRVREVVELVLGTV
jgi:hypothetical protein